MRRTQINLEEWQYQALRARAAQENRSMSHLVREILQQMLANPGARITSKKYKVSPQIRLRADVPTIGSFILGDGND